MNKLKVALAGTFRPIFHGDMKGVLNNSIEILKKKSVELDFDFIPVTRGMETLGDAETVAKQLEAEKVDLVVIQNSSFADGDMILPFFRTSARLAVWAVEETTTTGPLPLNSFCATNLYMSIAGRFSGKYDRPVKWLYGNASSEIFSRRFDTTIRALRAVKKMKQSKILMIGELVPGYHDEKFDPEKLRNIFGITIERIDLDEFYKEYESVGGNGEVAAKVKEIKEESSGSVVPDLHITNSARAEVAFQKMISNHQASAITFRCWPEVPGKIALMVCSTIGRLNQTDTVAATETDVLGAISMLTLKYLSGRETVLMDLSAWEIQSDSIYIWHCGNIPKSWFDSSGFRLSTHFNRDTIGVVREGKMKSCEVTALRFLENDSSAFLASGRFSDKGSPLYKGCSAWMNDLKINGRPIKSEDYMNTLLVNAVPHHLSYVDKDLTTDVNEFCAWLGIKIMEPVYYQDYLQRPRMFPEIF
jgi:L-fucose isomerase-like protein